MPRTVLLTGVTGFVARHCALALLEAGHVVRGTLRDPGRADAVRAALGPALSDPAALARLDFVTLDLLRDAGWDAAMAGCDAVMHTASPFPLAPPTDPGMLIRPAVDGTLRALRGARAAGIDRVVLTSSTAAVVNTPLRPGRGSHDEDDWTDPASPSATPYVRSKLLAERAAWDFVRDEAPGMRLTVINPGLVLGPPLGTDFGSSVGVVRRILLGRDPAMPAIGFPVVDVRDVATMHLRALERPATAGRRYLAVAGSMWMTDMGRVLKQAWPERRIPTRRAPTLLLRLLALADPAVRAILPSLGRMEQASNARAVAEMDMRFIPPDEALLATAAALIERRLV
jgi:dihydroflavonol-4-reductase